MQLSGAGTRTSWPRSWAGSRTHDSRGPGSQAVRHHRAIGRVVRIPSLALRPGRGRPTAPSRRPGGSGHPSHARSGFRLWRSRAGPRGGVPGHRGRVGRDHAEDALQHGDPRPPPIFAGPCFVGDVKSRSKVKVKVVNEGSGIARYLM